MLPRKVSSFAAAAVAALFAGLGIESRLAVAAESTGSIATEVDRRLADEVFQNLSAGQQLAPRADDEIFLRRVYLDLVGQPPTPNEVTLFVLDPAGDKRSKKIASLLDNPRFGVNAANYWRDVILSRQQMAQQAQLVIGPLETYLTEQFNQNVAWDKIARAFVEAKGPIADHGEGAVFVAQMAEPVDVAAETSRIFLGIQIQCAQCHDHPTDRWKRQQFHEFAAFFPRVGLRRAMMANRPTLELASFDNGPMLRRPGMFGQGAQEHFMPDLKDPNSQGKMMTPVFFATGQQLNTGTLDEQRRQSLAEWMTASDNPWFAKAFVNRLWAELVGEGFYEPVDDIGPDRRCSAPQTLDYLASQFTTHAYDIKWLYRTIAETEAYQRQSRPKRNPDQAPFTANVPQRLRADQLIDVLSQAVGFDLTGSRQPPGGAPPGFVPRSPLHTLFSFDPSVRREEITSTIPQALALMNSQFLNRAVTARTGQSMLSQLLAQARTDEQAVVDLYLQVLSREPSDREISVCLDHMKEIGSADTLNGRYEAFEDLFWALLNSEELRYRY